MIKIIQAKKKKKDKIQQHKCVPATIFWNREGKTKKYLSQIRHESFQLYKQFIKSDIFEEILINFNFYTIYYEPEKQ